MMEELIFSVQGSEPEPYTVTFRREGTNFTARCTCRAGVMGQMCKHRLNLLQQETSGLVSGNVADVAHLPGMFMGTDVERAFQKLVDAEKALDAARSEFDRRKKALARAMHD